MARASKKETVKKEVAVTEVSGVTGIKEESEKGELFFKIVLIVMAVALLGVIIYFVVDAIIGDSDDETETRFNANNYVTLTEIGQIKQIGTIDFASISNIGLRETLDSFDYVYVLFYSENQDNLSDSAKDRENTVLSLIDQILEYKVEVNYDDESDDGYIYYTIGNDIAFFFVDVTNAVNASWATSIDTSAGQASFASAPVLLEVINGEDLKWYGPWSANGQNKATYLKLSDILESLQLA